MIHPNVYYESTKSWQPAAWVDHLISSNPGPGLDAIRYFLISSHPDKEVVKHVIYIRSRDKLGHMMEVTRMSDYSHMLGYSRTY